MKKSVKESARKSVKKSVKESRFSWEDIKDFCETLTEAEGALTREMVSRISDKWSLWTMSVIAEHGRPMRFSRIMDQVEAISQKSLTKTLRGLERDGLITREVFAEVPPRVEYTITTLGSEMLNNVAPLWLWVAKSVQRFQDCRAAFNSSRTPARKNS
jgi:DNA-binding HxlR family transcriptional regulator